MGTNKSVVVSVRVEPRIKLALQEVAGLEMRSVANMVEVMVVDYCRTKNVSVESVSEKATSAGKQKKKRE
jgi:hypothetical protein